MTDFVSREEFERLAARLDSIDAVGTRGVAVLAVQMTELAKDFARHEQVHERTEAARDRTRRWWVGAVIAVVAAIDGPVVTVILAAHGH